MLQRSRALFSGRGQCLHCFSTDPHAPTPKTGPSIVPLPKGSRHLQPKWGKDGSDSIAAVIGDGRTPLPVGRFTEHDFKEADKFSNLRLIAAAMFLLITGQAYLLMYDQPFELPLFVMALEQLKLHFPEIFPEKIDIGNYNNLSRQYF